MNDTVLDDPRLLTKGSIIPSEGYCDQPYVVHTADGAWLCVMTTGTGNEGDKGQHVITMRSTDHGKTWSTPVDVEPADGPEASYAVLLRVPSDRIYVFYNHNTDRVKEVIREDGGTYSRVDSLGYFVFKYSDDHGRTWSPKRYTISVREFEVDRANTHQGKVRFFWNVGRPSITQHGAIVPLHKVAAMGRGFYSQSEGAFLRSENILHEKDAEKITFDTLPDGDVGLRTPPGGGRIAEEQSITELSDGSIYCVYRSVDGWPVCSYSRDGGHTWTPPQYKTYGPGERRFKHSRAANFVWRCGNGKYLYWFHNHSGGEDARGKWDAEHDRGTAWSVAGCWNPYDDRNPAWVSAGVEYDGPAGKELRWSEPEILLYVDDPIVRMSYPDLVEENGRFWVTETQKLTARTHEIDTTLLEGLFAQVDGAAGVASGAVVDAAAPGASADAGDWSVAVPELPYFIKRDHSTQEHRSLDLRAGTTWDVELELGALQPGRVLLSTMLPTGRGVELVEVPGGAVEIRLSDGRTQNVWRTDHGVILAGQTNRVTIIMDGGPKLILFIVNGKLCDGAEERQFGFGRYSPHLMSINAAEQMHLAAGVRHIRIYPRALRVSEAVANQRS